MTDVDSGEIALPSWLAVESILPAFAEFEELTRQGFGHMRMRSRISDTVDPALKAFWDAMAAVRSSPLEPTFEQVDGARRALSQVQQACLEYIRYELPALDGPLLQLSSEGGVTPPSARARETVLAALGKTAFACFKTPEDIAAERSAALEVLRPHLLAIKAKERVPPTFLLLALALSEEERWRDWKRGRPPAADLAEAWSGMSLLPVLEMWKLESSGGEAKRWVFRASSRITTVDDALAQYWLSFKRLDRDQTLRDLEALIAAVDGYLAHKDRDQQGVEMTARAAKKARVSAAKRLKVRAVRERDRLQQGWTTLLPPRVPGFGAAVVAEGRIDLHAPGAVHMANRTNVYTSARWNQESEVPGRAFFRSDDLKNLIDRRLDEFWYVFTKYPWTSPEVSHKGASLDALDRLLAGCIAYRNKKAASPAQGDGFDPTGTTNPRMAAVGALYRTAEEEYRRLSAQWPDDGGLPPVAADDDSALGPEQEQELSRQLEALDGEVDAQAMRAMDADGLAAFLTVVEGAGSTAAAGAGPTDPIDRELARLLGASANHWFAHSRSVALRGLEPADASMGILAQRRADKKWVARQLAAMQACSLVNYPEGVKKKLQGKPQEERNRYRDLFQNVVTVADAVARQMRDDFRRTRNASAWTVLAGPPYGWADDAPELLFPMVSLATLVFACKWNSGAAEGAKLWAMQPAGGKTLFTIVGATGSLVGGGGALLKDAEKVGANAVGGALQDGRSAIGGATGANALVAAGAGVGIATALFSLQAAVREHRRLGTMLERYALLEQTLPQVAEMIDSNPFFYRLRLALAGKVGRRQTRAKVEAGKAVVGIASGTGTIVATYAGVAAANAWNPIGWTLTAIGLLALAGGLAHAIHQRYVNEAQLVELRKKYNIPSCVKTSGEWERYMIADLIFRASVNDVSMGAELLAIGQALRYLVLGEDAKLDALRMGHMGIMQFLKDG